MNMIAGAYYRAASNKALTLLGPTPTYISINSVAEHMRNETPLSFAVALANIVFPVPGGPKIKIPFLNLAPAY